MNFEEFKSFILEETNKNNISLVENKLQLFYDYMKGIIGWNDKINVTAITDEKEFIIKHFMDSLVIINEIQDNDRVIDIGTGAGFPGIPVKFVREKSKMVLIDSVNKKLNVIREITKNMNLDNLEIIHTRAEELAQDKKYREQFDVATTRAVSGLSTIAEYMLPFIKIGGKAICMKGPNYKEELEESKNAIKILGGEIEEVKTISVSGEFERNIIIIKKVKNTSSKYPRNAGKPVKDPLK